MKLILRTNKPKFKLVSKTGVKLNMTPTIVVYTSVGGGSGVPYQAGFGLTLIGNEFAVDQGLIATKEFLDDSVTGLATTQYVDDSVTGLATTQYVDDSVTGLATETALAEVEDLAGVNALKINQLQYDVDGINQIVSDNYTALDTAKADKTTLDVLQTLVDTKATPADITAAITNLVGAAPQALDTIYEIAAQLQGDAATIGAIMTALGNCVRFDSAQSLTTPQQTQARSNIDAEKAGTAAAAVAAITPASIGAAITAQGAKADTALQPGDVAPVALSGSFMDLVNKSGLFTLVYAAYTIGANVAIAATDTLGQMLGKLQAQISALATVARTGSYTDLANKPTIPAAQVQTDWNAVSGLGVILNKPTIPPAFAVIEVKTANYAITAADNGKILIANGSGITFTFNAVASLGSGFNIAIYAIQTVTLTAQAGQLISGVNSRVLYAGFETEVFGDASTLRLWRNQPMTPLMVNTVNGYTVATAIGDGGIALGKGATAGTLTTHTDVVAIGTSAFTNGKHAVAIGRSATANNETDIAIGSGAATKSIGGINASGAIALGAGVKTTQAGEMVWSPSGNTFQSGRLLVKRQATAANTNYSLVAVTSGVTPTNYNLIPCKPRTTTTFWGVVTVKQLTADGSNNMSWRVEGQMYGDQFGTFTTLLSFVATPLAGMTAPAGWALTATAYNNPESGLALVFNMGSTAMNLTAFADMFYTLCTY